MRLRPAVVAFFVAIAVGLCSVGVWAWSEHVRATALRRAFALFERGQYAQALPSLGDSARVYPDRQDIRLALGMCEYRTGNIDRATATWSSIDPGSAVGRAANAYLLLAARESGRLSIARRVLATNLPSDESLGPGALEDFVFLRRIEGQTDAARAALRLAATRSSDPAPLLKQLWAIDTDPFPVDGAGSALRNYERLAPKDSGVALALAHVAIVSSDLKGAREWLDAARQRGASVEECARLELMLARVHSDGAAALKAAESLGSEELSVEDWLAMRAELVRGDAEAEHAALRDLLTHNPQHAEALNRMAELASPAPPDEAIDVTELATYWRKRKARRDDAQRRYEGLLESDAAAAAVELAQTAQKLGRAFDAQVWWKLASRRDPGDERARDALRALVSLNHDTPLARARARQSVLDTRALIQSSQPNIQLAVDTPRSPEFVDAAESSGLVFHFDNGATAQKQLPETMSGGVALLDFDNDGWLDVYLVQGGVFPPPPRAACADRLFRNRGDGTFEDVSERVGLPALPGGYGHGVAIGDVDDDGLADVFVTRFDHYALYLNDGGKRFVDATVEYGLGGSRDWPTSAAFADFDADGDLDLYVCHYAEWDAARPKICTRPDGAPTYCPPAALAARSDHLFRNDGGQYVDVSDAAGISAADTQGRGLGVVAADLDGDHRIDIFVANDTTANFFFHNLGDMRFEERALAAGLAANASGGYLAGMGVAHGDLDGDGRLDLAVTNFYGECTTFYRAVGDGMYVDSTADIGLNLWTRNQLGFGIAMGDVNNDGWLDIAQANGHVDDYAPAYPYAMPTQLFLGSANGRLVPSAPTNAPWKTPRVGRGLAMGDADNDGRLDVFVVDQRGAFAYFRNQLSDNDGHFVTLRLEASGGHRDAVGATVVVEAGGRRWLAARYGGGSYQSSGDPRVHVGLGKATRIDRIEVRWPSGEIGRYDNLESDRGYLVVEGMPAAQLLTGYDRANNASPPGNN